MHLHISCNNYDLLMKCLVCLRCLFFFSLSYKCLLLMIIMSSLSNVHFFLLISIFATRIALQLVDKLNLNLQLYEYAVGFCLVSPPSYCWPRTLKQLCKCYIQSYKYFLTLFYRIVQLSVLSTSV